MLVYLGLGSNLGGRLQQLQRAVDALSAEVKIKACSSVYETTPWGYTDQPDFLNAVIAVETEQSPGQLLELCRRIEREQGRRRRDRWREREIDIDLLLAGRLVMEERELTLPHPQLMKRDFVLVPLLEIAPELNHPVSGELIQERIKEEPGLKLYHGGLIVETEPQCGMKLVEGYAETT